MHPWGITVEFQRATVTVDEWNNERPGAWETTHVVSGVAFDPGGISGGVIQMDEQGRIGQVREPRLLSVPNDLDIRDRDRVIINGETWDVEGTPHKWVNPMTGWSPGQEIKLKRVEG